MSRIEELEKRLAADPNSRIFVQLAEEYRKQGLLENAIEICEEGLKKHPKYPSARVALGRALLEAESFDRASAEFEAVLAQVPDNILANKFLGETYHRLGRLNEAIQKYQIAQTLAPEDHEIEGRIAAVKADIAGGGAPPPKAPTPDAADETAPADPNEYRSAPTPSPPPPPAGDAPLEPTLVDAPPSIPEPAAPMGASEPAPPSSSEPDLAPIPLVEVDEPMILESASYTPMEPPIESKAPPAPPPPTEAKAPPPIEREREVEFEPASMEPEIHAPPPMADEPPAAEPSTLEFPATAPMKDDIETPTMAELYASQGHFDKAILVYRNLIARKPNETKYLERVEELQMLAQPSSALGPGEPLNAGSQRTIEVLEEWLDNIRRSRRA